MAQTVKLKRSAVSGNTPTTSDLALGEIAINTYDGNIFIKKNDGTESIVTFSPGSNAGTIEEDSFSGNGSTTAFTLSSAPSSEEHLLVFIDATFQNRDSFTISGTTITFDTAPDNGSSVRVYHVIPGSVDDGVLTVAKFAADTLVLESEGISSNDNDTTIPTSAAVKDYVDTQITAEDLDITTDSGTIAIDLDSETLTISGGTGLDSSATGNAVTLAIDSTVTTLTGTQTLTNKTLTSPVINTGVSGTAFLDDDTFATATATTLASSESIKAYVDSQVATVDTLPEVLANGNTTGGTDIAVSTGDDITFADSSKALFGDDSDLQIYSSGSYSFIREVGTGGLYLDTNGDGIYLRGTTGNENMVRALKDGAVTLFYDGSEKLATTADGISVTSEVEADEFIGDLRGAVLFKAQAGENVTKGDVVYISGISGNTTVVSKADADDTSKMPAFGIVAATTTSGQPVDIYTQGILGDLDTSSYSEGDELFVSTTAGALTNTAPTGETAAIQKIAKVTRSNNLSGSIFITGAGRSNATPNLDEDQFFLGNASNQAVATDFSDAVEALSINNVVEDTTPQLGGNLASNGNDILFADSDKAIFGTGSDLQIYHDGSHSYIDEVGTGRLYIRAADNITFTNADGSETYANFSINGAVGLRYDNQQKIITTSTGIDVTGEVLADSLDIDGNGDISGNLTLGGYLAGPATFTIDPAAVGDNTGTVVIAGNLQVDGTTTTINSTTLTVDDKNITLASGSTNAAAANGAGLTVDCGSDTDATFTYDGTNDEWDFNKNINVTGTIRVSDNILNAGAAGSAIIFNEDGTTADFRVESSSNTHMLFVDGGNDRVGIGTSSPLAPLDVVRGGTTGLSSVNARTALLVQNNLSNGTVLSINAKNTGYSGIFLGDQDNEAICQIQYVHTDDKLKFLTNGGGYNPLTLSGTNVGVGNTSPSAVFQVEEYGIDTTETSTTATTQVAIHTMSATAFRSARFTVQVTNSTDSTYHLTEILMIHDGTTPSITEYGTIFTGSAEATFDADISSGNVRLLATPASTDTMEFKVVAHSIAT